MIHYVSDDILDEVFDYVSTRYARVEEVPQYRQERGLNEFCGILKQSRSDTYYPTLLEKAAYLLIGINKGHFFSNGNKRLSLVVTALFLAINGMQFKTETKGWYKERLSKVFPEYSRWEDFEEFASTDFATYNLSIMIADSGVYKISHDELKFRVLTFLKEATTHS